MTQKLLLPNRHQDLVARVFTKLKPPTKLTVSEWAEQFRYLTSGSSANPGLWKNTLTPYLVQIMNDFSEPHVSKIVVMKSSQVGYTELLLNIIGFTIDQSPSSTLMVLPTLELARMISKSRISKMIADCPSLTQKVSDPLTKSSANTILEKQFSGCSLALVGSNSAAGLASRAVRIVLGDEIDRFSESARGSSLSANEGDPLSLAVKRTSTFFNPKIFIGSTPTIKSSSAIEFEFEQSNKSFYHVKCPHCNHEQTLEFEQIKYANNDPKTSQYECISCNQFWDDFINKKIVQEGRWISTVDSSTHGYFINELMSPFVLFETTVRSYLESKNTPEREQTFVNTSLGLPYEIASLSASIESLMDRREDYGPEIPNDAVVLTAGVDIQADRIEVETVAHASNGSSWSMEYNVFQGDTSSEPSNKNSVWEQLNDYLKSTFKHESGRPMRIVCTCIDSGFHTTQVKKFVKGKAGRRIFCIKGMAGKGRPIINTVKRRTQGTPIFIVGTDTAKDLLVMRLKLSPDQNGYCHFPLHYEENFFKMLTAEKAVTHYLQGRPVRKWELKEAHGRNEALDCRVYALAALNLLNPNFPKLDKLFLDVLPVPENTQEPKPEPVLDSTILKPKTLQEQTKRKRNPPRKRQRNSIPFLQRR